MAIKNIMKKFINIYIHALYKTNSHPITYMHTHTHVSANGAPTKVRWLFGHVVSGVSNKAYRAVRMNGEV